MKGLWVPLSGALAQEKRVETIANNIANATTPGFKKDHITFKEYLTVFDKGYTDINLPDKEWSPEDFYRSYGAEESKVEVHGSFTDFKQGQLVPTGNPLDLALNGKGFFEILTPRGIRASRRGAFAFSSNGLLVDSQGNPVLSQQKRPSGEPENFEPRKIKLPRVGKISINLNGDIFLKDNKVGTLSIVSFNDIHTLKKEGNSYFINNNKANLIPTAKNTTLHQGFIEGSNVNAISEMSELIKANRQFESIQRVLKAYDHIAGKTANDIANF